MARIYIPGLGELEPAAYRCHLKCREYDERLSFKWNEATGEWCVFIQMPRGWAGGLPEMPVLGFGREIPHPDTIQQKLWENDTLRDGNDLLLLAEKEIAAQNKAEEQLFYESMEEPALRMEHILRGVGESPHANNIQYKRKRYKK